MFNTSKDSRLQYLSKSCSTLSISLETTKSDGLNTISSISLNKEQLITPETSSSFSIRTTIGRSLEEKLKESSLKESLSSWIRREKELREENEMFDRFV